VWLPRCFGAFCLLLLEMFVENFAVFVVSATDVKRYDYVSLQDNVRILVLRLMERSSVVQRAIVKFPGWEFHAYVAAFVALLGVAFCSAFFFSSSKRLVSGFGIAYRFFAATAATRALRVVAFLLTVMPSPRPTCFMRRFQEPPTDWLGWIKVGLYKVRSGGGCNDLVISGHGIMTSAVVFAATEYLPVISVGADEPQPAAASRSRFFTLAINGLVASLFYLPLLHTSVVAVVERHHYSVDMFLAFVITRLVWNRTRELYCNSKVTPAFPEGSGGSGGQRTWSPMAAVVLFVGATAVLSAIVVVGGA
jgi:hypothetical protein